MTIASLLFDPRGSVTRPAFTTGALILIAVGFLIAVLALLNPFLGVITFFVGLAVMYCWVALWIKRLHGAGASGWWTVLIVLGWMILDSTVEFAVLSAFGIDFMAMSASQGGDFGAMLAQMESITEQVAIPSAVSSAIVSLAVALGLNAVLPDGRTRQGAG